MGFSRIVRSCDERVDRYDVGRFLSLSLRCDCLSLLEGG